MTPPPEDRGVPPLPTLSEEDIALRAWTEHDVVTLVQAMKDPEIPRWLPVIAQPYGPEEAREFIAWAEQQWTTQRGLHTAIVERDAGTVLGSVGMHLNLADESGSLGYWVMPWARGRGIASRGAKILARWAFESLSLQRIELLAEVDNTASQRAAEKAGFRREGLLRSKIKQRTGRADAYIFSLLPSDPRL